MELDDKVAWGKLFRRLFRTEEAIDGAPPVRSMVPEEEAEVDERELA